MATGKPKASVRMMKTAGTELRIPPIIKPDMKARVRLRNVICWKKRLRVLSSVPKALSTRAFLESM